MVCCKLSDYYHVINMKAWSQKKVTRVDKDDNSLEVILEFIDFVNSMDELETVVWDNHHLDDVLVLNEFKDFIQPAAVRFDALNRRTSDQLLRPEIITNPCPTYAAYVEACDRFRSRFKKDGYSDTVSIGSLRKTVNFNDVVTRASFNGLVCAQGKPFWPVPLAASSLFEDRYFNETLEQCCDDYIAEMRFV